VNWCGCETRQYHIVRLDEFVYNTTFPISGFMIGGVGAILSFDSLVCHYMAII
jgi:hypothetical protein